MGQYQESSLQYQLFQKALIICGPMTAIFEMCLMIYHWNKFVAYMLVELIYINASCI